MAEIEKAKVEFELKLIEQEKAGKAREEVHRKEQNTVLDAIREEAERRMAADRNQQQTEALRLQKAIEQAAAREDLREQNTPASVRSQTWGISLYGYVQGEYQLRQSSENQLDASGKPLNQDRFMVRRARLGLTMDRTYGEGRIEIDGNTMKRNGLRLVDAEASLRWPGQGGGAPPVVMGTIGLFKIPFGHEVPQDDRQRLFMERTTAARALFPGEYDIGVRIAGGWQFIRYVLAVQNGQPLDGNSFASIDPNNQKDVTGRIGVEHSVTNIEVIGGISGLWGKGFHPASTATKATLQWNDANENGRVEDGEVTGSPGLSASSSSSFTRLGFGADMSISARWSPMLRTSLVTEFYLASNLDRAVMPADPKGIVGRDFRELGYYIAFIQEYGQWRLGVRYDYYNPDQDANKNAKGNPVPTNASYSTLAAVAGCAVSWGRLMVEYDYNRNHTGIDLNGMPTNLSDNAILVRGEVGF